MPRHEESEIAGGRSVKRWSAQIAGLLKACADPTRLRLLNLLAREGEVCVCHLVDVLGTNQPKVSRHLAYLKRAGLVTDRKDGLWVHYRLSEALGEHASRLVACLNACAAEAPEMQRDLYTLQRIRDAQPLVKLTRKVRASVADTALVEERPAVHHDEREMRVELL